MFCKFCALQGAALAKHVSETFVVAFLVLGLVAFQYGEYDFGKTVAELVFLQHAFKQFGHVVGRILKGSATEGRTGQTA